MMGGRGRGRGRADLFNGPEERRPLRRPGGDGPAPTTPATPATAPTTAGQQVPAAAQDISALETRGTVISSERLPTQQQHDIADRIQVLQKFDTLDISAEPAEQEILTALRSTHDDVELSAAVRGLHEKAVRSQAVATSLATASGRLQTEAADGSHLRNLRTHLLNLVQSDYKRRHDDRVSDPARFAGACWLLCEVFRCARLADGSVVRVLAVPILENLTALLHCRQEDQLSAVKQLSRIGGDLFACDAESVQTLLASIRERLVSADCAHALRPDLLLCVELAAAGWRPLAAHARHFYTHHGVALPPGDASASAPAAAAAGSSQTAPADADAGRNGGLVTGTGDTGDRGRTVEQKSPGKVESKAWIGKALPEDDWD